MKWADWAAEWQRAARFDPYHKGSGPGGGQFTSSGNAGSGAAAMKKTGAGHHPAPMRRVPGQPGRRAAEKRSLLEQAAADRKEIRALTVELHALERQEKAAQAAAKASAAKAKAAAKSGTSKGGTVSKATTHHQAAKKHHAHSVSLKSRISGLKSRISHLRAQVVSLDAEAAKL